MAKNGIIKRWIKNLKKDKGFYDLSTPLEVNTSIPIEYQVSRNVEYRYENENIWKQNGGVNPCIQQWITPNREYEDMVKMFMEGAKIPYVVLKKEPIIEKLAIKFCFLSILIDNYLRSKVVIPLMFYEPESENNNQIITEYEKIKEVEIKPVEKPFNAEFSLTKMAKIVYQEAKQNSIDSKELSDKITKIFSENVPKKIKELFLKYYIGAFVVEKFKTNPDLIKDTGKTNFEPKQKKLMPIINNEDWIKIFRDCQEQAFKQQQSYKFQLKQNLNQNQFLGSPQDFIKLH